MRAGRRRAAVYPYPWKVTPGRAYYRVPSWTSGKRANREEIRQFWRKAAVKILTFVVFAAAVILLLGTLRHPGPP